jgi:hypothetical protein
VIVFKCDVCHKTSQPGEPKKKHCFYRSDGSIKDELDLCRSCFTVLESGVPFADLVQRHKKARDTPPVPSPWIGKSVLDTEPVPSPVPNPKPLPAKRKQPVKFSTKKELTTGKIDSKVSRDENSKQHMNGTKR